ncbi:hypothetical protein M427DRAFT_51824 [Gonapodya prolifera JEL478]|uniref:Uncharacterized protein n=1 Tax=Gonapodya prolifera (strain JEL478) TaxID=1344416 RepID=A0A139AVY5_GONPJ|nr:hypothetical protein M427DRAFT_51824 [Gonapodya prolifera JEL478]|eukprot:KXS20869.1 hypothetical protein M427DRAFT_51824 [Gonapodya prolifera JEL478]
MSTPIQYPADSDNKTSDLGAAPLGCAPPPRINSQCSMGHGQPKKAKRGPGRPCLTAEEKRQRKDYRNQLNGGLVAPIGLQKPQPSRPLMQLDQRYVAIGDEPGAGGPRKAPFRWPMATVLHLLQLAIEMEPFRRIPGQTLAENYVELVDALVNLNPLAHAGANATNVTRKLEQVLDAYREKNIDALKKSGDDEEYTQLDKLAEKYWAARPAHDCTRNPLPSIRDTQWSKMQGGMKSRGNKTWKCRYMQRLVKMLCGAYPTR